jgi:hypothetical protein
MNINIAIFRTTRSPSPFTGPFELSRIQMWKMVISRCPQVGWQYQTPIRFPACERGYVNPNTRSWKSCYLIELDVRKPLVVYISQTHEELSLYNMVLNLTISNPGLKAVSSKASPGWTVNFCGRWSRFPERGSQYLFNGINNISSSLANFFLSSDL